MISSTPNLKQKAINVVTAIEDMVVAAKDNFKDMIQEKKDVTTDKAEDIKKATKKTIKKIA
jgi:hypothetical protein